MRNFEASLPLSLFTRTVPRHPIVVILVHPRLRSTFLASPPLPHSIAQHYSIRSVSPSWLLTTTHPLAACAAASSVSDTSHVPSAPPSHLVAQPNNTTTPPTHRRRRLLLSNFTLHSILLHFPHCSVSLRLHLPRLQHRHSIITSLQCSLIYPLRPHTLTPKPTLPLLHPTTAQSNPDTRTAIAVPFSPSLRLRIPGVRFGLVTVDNIRFASASLDQARPQTATQINA